MKMGDKLHDNKTSSPPPSSDKNILPKGIEGEVTAAIHMHPAGDVLSEDFSKETIKNPVADETIMSEIDEIDYYLLTPSGKLLERDHDYERTLFLGIFDENTDVFVKGGKLKNVDDKDLQPQAMDKDDPLKPGNISIPWNPSQLPPNWKHDTVNPGGRNCIGCYIDPPEWLKPKHSTTITNN